MNEIHQECFDCHLPDCYPTSPHCPIVRAKAAAKGIELPEREPPPRPVERGELQKREGITPTSYTDRDDYLRKYQRVYKSKLRRVALRGVFLQRSDLEILSRVCSAEGRTLEEEVTTLLELMAENARAKLQVTEGA